MVGLNVQTLYLIGAVVTICGAGAALLTWYHHRDAPGLRAWIAALFLTSVAALALKLRGSPSDFALTLAANAVIIMGFAAMWASLRLFNQGRRDALRFTALVAATTAAFVLTCLLMDSMGAGRRATAIPFSFFFGMVGLLSAYEMWRGHERDGLRSRLPTALAFLALGLARLVRAATLALEVWQVTPPRSAAMIHPYTLYAAIVLTVVITYGLVAMANEQAAQRDARLLGSHARSPAT